LPQAAPQAGYDARKRVKGLDREKAKSHRRPHRRPWLTSPSRSKHSANSAARWNTVIEPVKTWTAKEGGIHEAETEINAAKQKAESTQAQQKAAADQGGCGRACDRHQGFEGLQVVTALRQQQKQDAMS